MARKLKVFRTSIGFFELAVAAPSMKAAAEAWGADPDIFKRGFAEETDDVEVVEATMAAPGVVLRRPVGSDGEFSEHAALPKVPERARAASNDLKNKPGGKADEAEKRAAALKAKQEKEASERQKREEAERERAMKQRERMIAKANAAFEKAQARHNDVVASLKRRQEEVEGDKARENERWEAEQRQHKDALKELGS